MTITNAPDFTPPLPPLTDASISHALRQISTFGATAGKDRDLARMKTMLEGCGVEDVAPFLCAIAEAQDLGHEFLAGAIVARLATEYVATEGA